MIRILITKLRKERLSSFFLLLGMTIAFLMMSLATNFVYEILQSNNKLNNAKPPNGHIFQINLATPYGTNDYANIDKITECFSKTNNNTGIYTEVDIEADDMVNCSYSVTAEWFDNDKVWHYPLYSGNYFTKEQIDNHEKVILVGKNFRHKIKEKEDGTQYYSIGGEDYTVCGIIGFNGVSTYLDKKLCIPITAIPDRYSKQLLTGNFQFTIYNDDDYILDNAIILKKEFSKQFEDVQINDLGAISDSSAARKIMSSKSNGIFYLSLIGYISSLVYAINIVSFWLEKRKKEMAIRKAFGYSNKQLALILYKEMLIISTLSCILGLIVQFILKNILSKYLSFNLNINIKNIGISIIAVLFTALFTTIWPARKIMKFEPIKNL